MSEKLGENRACCLLLCPGSHASSAGIKCQHCSVSMLSRCQPFECFGYFSTRHKHAKIFKHYLNPDLFGIPLKALAEYYHMNIKMRGFQSYIFQYF